MKHYADIETTGYDDGAIVHIKIGALRVSLTLDNSQRIALCRALLGGRGEAHAAVLVGPLTLPKGMREIDEKSLNARGVE